VRYEGYGPGGVAVLVEAFTDNRHRTAAEVRLAFNKQGGNLGETGCVGYLFELRGVVRLAATGLEEESLLEALIRLEASGGAIALGYDAQADGGWEVSSNFAALEALQDGLRTCGLAVESWEQRWIPKPAPSSWSWSPCEAACACSMPWKTSMTCAASLPTWKPMKNC
jgi:transcriptional/translational regulatory protein YebC/TACO1